jgi:fused signal recognition particle receptor
MEMASDERHLYLPLLGKKETFVTSLHTLFETILSNPAPWLVAPVCLLLVALATQLGVSISRRRMRLQADRGSAPQAVVEKAQPPADEATIAEGDRDLPAAVQADQDLPAVVHVDQDLPAPKPAPKPPASLRERLAQTSNFLIGGFERALGGGKLEGEVLDEIEDLLFTADLGVKTADSLLGSIRREAAGKDATAVVDALRAAVLKKLTEVERAPVTGTTPHVILVLGVNGAGKTTTIGKLAARYKAEGKKVILGAGDTFRAAATEQLQVWGERVGCDVIAGSEGGDPAAVVFDAMKAGVARGADVIIIDTAGRLQTKKPLMEELTKIVRVIGREVETAPHETLLVLDANTGQNALSQARVFTEAAGVTGLVLTKLDGTAKGGVLVGLADEFQIPVRYVGVGEALDDLRDFSAQEFVDALFGPPSSQA